MALPNLPGAESTKVDKNTRVQTPNDNPITLVLGTSSSGPAQTFHRVQRISDSVNTFGKVGTLSRGLLESNTGGAANLRAMRIGGKAAVLGAIINSNTVTTIEKDLSAGDNYDIAYVSAVGQLTIRRVVDGTTVLFIDAGDPSAKIDLNEVQFDGTFSIGDGTDINDAAGDPVLLSEVTTIGDSGSPLAGATFVPGEDGVNLSRIQLYEELYNAYQLLRDQQFDIVNPMDTYLDDQNTYDQLDSTVSGLWASQTTYPLPGSPADILGLVHVDEFQGENHFHWLFVWDRPSAEAGNDPFVTAEVFPSGVGSASATADVNGTTLTYSDFHEVNFGYQLANFCYTVSQENNECHGVIGVLPPNSFSLKDVATWVGTEPTLNDLNTVVVTNGTGLLGNKWMAGKISTGTGVTRIRGHVVDGIDGNANGGFIATDTGFIDGVQQKDENSALIDIGKYLDVVSAQPILSNSVNTSYVSTGASIYGGFTSTLSADSAPTNKVMPGVGLPFRINITKVNLLAGKRYVHFHEKEKGIVVSDAPTSARPDSDYTRRQTVRIVQTVIDAIRRVADPFLGEGLSGARLVALETAIDRVLNSMQKEPAAILNRYDKVLISTPELRVLGKAVLQLTLVPATELRQIDIVVSLAAS